MKALVMITVLVVFAGVVYLLVKNSKKKNKLTSKPGTGSSPKIPRQQ